MRSFPHFQTHVQGLEGDPARQAEAQQYAQFLQAIVNWRSQVNQQASMIAQAEQQNQAAQQADQQKRLEQASRDKVGEAHVKASQDAQAKVVVGLAGVEADKVVDLAKVAAKEGTDPDGSGS